MDDIPVAKPETEQTPPPMPSAPDSTAQAPPVQQAPAAEANLPIEPQVPPEPVPSPAAAAHTGQTAPPPNFQARQVQAKKEKKAKRLRKLLELARKNGNAGNDDIQKYLIVSDATASRYAAELVKKGLLKKTGVGRYARYHPV